jgi:hypothetical protein
MAFDKPFNHLGLTAPPVLRDMSGEQLEANTDVAMEAVVGLFNNVSE